MSAEPQPDRSVEPNPDWYGTYARKSALADFIEILALDGGRLRPAELADLVRDSGWTYRLGERISAPEEDEPSEPSLSEEQDESTLRAKEVFDILADRVRLGGASYPFTVEEDGSVRYTAGDPVGHPYVALLAITVGHALKVTATVPPHEVFEDTVVTCMVQRGIPTAGLGALARAGNDFSETLTIGCEQVGLDAYPDAAARRTFAQEEGSDTISNVWPRDRRPGGLQIVGQATCGKSDDWTRKIHEPSFGLWRSWLGRFIEPRVFLAVPHHVEPGTMRYVLEQSGRDVVDRMRLLSMKDAVSAAEADIARMVLGLGVALP